MNEDLSNLSMAELFRVETETQAGILTRGLLELERGTATPELLEELMRAAHSLKGAARIVNQPLAVQVAHALEDSFVAAQKSGKAKGQRLKAEGHPTLSGLDENVGVPESEKVLGSDFSLQPSAFPSAFSLEPLSLPSIDALLRGVDLLVNLSKGGHPPAENEIRNLLAELTSGKSEGSRLKAKAQATSAISLQPSALEGSLQPSALRASVRLGAENLNRLLALAGESLVETRWLRPFQESLQRLKRMLDEEKDKGERQKAEAHSTLAFSLEPSAFLREARQYLAERLEELDQYDRRCAQMSNRLYLEVLRARMRPFGDGAAGFPRLVRDLARSLGKQVKLEIVGENTQVDRDILERLEAPLNHLLRNAVDHGCESPQEREAAGKPPEATIRLEARHSAGMLQVVVSDDGAGVDPARVRRLIADKKLTTPELAEKMSEPELLQFLFLPGFTLRETVTEFSGRGVGLDVVQDMVKSVRGSLRLASQPGRGTRFQMQLPLTMSVVRALLVEVGGEPYAIPLGQIVSTLKLPLERIEVMEGRTHFQLGQDQIGLLGAHQVLDCPPVTPPWRARAGQELPVVVLGERNREGFRGYGLWVDGFLGERELVVQPLDPRLGKVKDISAAALMEDGAPVLIVDVEDVLRSVEKLIATGELASVGRSAFESQARKRKRVLAVDDSLTVRELERKLLIGRGYAVDVAVDGMDGWNAARTGVYDLVITDVDMPRMDGIELASLIKRDPQLKALPVMIVSYKDREEDRLRGLEAGADYYLTKGSFHDETLLQAVHDLIGEPEEHPHS
jgi:two-component system sensor histidine kinase and response regulator WspE